MQTHSFIPPANGGRILGKHLIVDILTTTSAPLTCPITIEDVLLEAATATGATILFGHFHPFGEGQGVSGALILAESHISIHTWPEHDYAALDIFVCGDCDPWKAVPVLKAGFGAILTDVVEAQRRVPSTRPWVMG